MVYNENALLNWLKLFIVALLITKFIWTSTSQNCQRRPQEKQVADRLEARGAASPICNSYETGCVAEQRYHSYGGKLRVDSFTFSNISFYLLHIPFCFFYVPVEFACLKMIKRKNKFELTNWFQTAVVSVWLHHRQPRKFWNMLFAVSCFIISDIFCISFVVSLILRIKIDSWNSFIT